MYEKMTLTEMMNEAAKRSSRPLAIYWNHMERFGASPTHVSFGNFEHHIPEGFLVGQEGEQFVSMASGATPEEAARAYLKKWDEIHAPASD